MDGVRSLMTREQSLMALGLEAIARQLPFPVRGIDSDNDSAFINETLVQYCTQRGIEFTRSRAYRKNDQAWVEQKNGSVVRRFTGHDRCRSDDGPPLQGGKAVCELLPTLLQAAGENTRRSQDHQALQPAGHALRRLIQDDSTGAIAKEELREYCTGLDPVALLRSIRGGTVGTGGDLLSPASGNRLR